MDLVLRSREAPDRETLLRCRPSSRAWNTPARPLQIRADRAGLFAALYLLVVEGADSKRAMRELTLRKLHFRYAQTGILDAFIEAFRDEGEAKGKSFLQWVQEDYDPARLAREFRPRPLSSLVADRLLRRE